MQDELWIVRNIPCKACGGGRRARRRCVICEGSGFEKTDISNLWGKAGFLVCGGPSLNTLPLERLKERGVTALAVNNSGGYVPISAFCFSDGQEKFHHGLFADPKIMAFVPIPKMRKKLRVKLDDGFYYTDIPIFTLPNVYGFSRTAMFEPQTFFSSKHAYWGRGSRQPEEVKPDYFEARVLCTMLIGLRLIVHLGCRRIYLLGVDFKRTEENIYAFKEGGGVHNRRYVHENSYLHELKAPMKDLGIEVYNCNPTSGCDAFEYRSFNDAIIDCKGIVPPEPFDLKDWYGKRAKLENMEKHPQSITYDEVKRRTYGI